MGIFNVGVSGLNAAQLGILTTSHNISNASTEGYSRQQIYQTTNTPMFTGAGYLGQGTSVETVRRIYSRQLDQQVLAAKTGASEMESYLSQINQIDNLLADPSAGLSPALSSFFSATQEATANPSSIPARQAMLSASQALVARFDAIDQRMTEIRNGVNAQITSEVSAINSYAIQIAEINQRIIYAQAAGPNQPPNDLFDQRDVLVAELNERIRATTLVQSDGTYSVFIGNGQPLVVGTLAYGMRAVAAPDDPERTIVAIESPTGSTINMPESLLTGGTLGGLIGFRGETLDAAQNGLGRIALTLATNFNAQHLLGQDLQGNLGGTYFDTSLMGPTVRANGNNTGTGVFSAVIDAASLSSLTPSDYRLSFDGTNYNLLRLSDNSATTFLPAALPLTMDGFTLSVAGAPAAGDSFLIQPTRNGANNITMAIVDPRVVALAGPVRTATTLGNSGTASITAGSVTTTTGLPLASSPAGDITLSFDAANNRFNVTGGPGGTLAFTPTTDAAGKSFSFPTVGGFTFTIAGTPSDGDSFVISRNANGISDNRNGTLLGALQTQSTMENGTASYQSAYSTIVAQVGNKAREVEITGQAQQTLYEQAKATRDEMSGVNLDEEAANLLRYQQAYQAAAKMLDVATRVFDEILALGR